MPFHEPWLLDVPNRFFVAAGVVVVGLVLGYLVARINRRLLERAGVPAAVEGTAFERTMRGFGTSTVAIVAELSMWFIIVVTLLAALSVTGVDVSQQFWIRLTRFLPELFVAILVLIVGIVVGDKVELLIGERLRGIKLPQIGFIPRLVKYSIVFVAGLVALGQIGVATTALVVLLGVYTLAVVIASVVAFRDLLRSGAAGMYLLLNQPYGIGDEVRIGGERGIVQEITVLVTRIESEDVEYIVPNRRVFEQGVIKSIDE